MTHNIPQLIEAGQDARIAALEAKVAALRKGSPIDLKSLQAATDRILSTAQPHVTRPAVNWADLRCSDAREWRSVYGDTGYTVIVSEASPDAAELQGYVGLALMEQFGGSIEVVTEW